jgi:hypothetical protein
MPYSYLIKDKLARRQKKRACSIELREKCRLSGDRWATKGTREKQCEFAAWV